MTFKQNFTAKEKKTMNKLQEFEARKYQIENNIDLSAEGKKKALATLQREAENYRTAAIRDLGASWTVLKGKMKSNVESVKAAEAQAAAQWDYGRLNYMSQAVKTQVNSAASFDAVQSLYNKAMQSGDTHARRVWGEGVRENIAAKYKGGDVAVFVNKLQKELNGVLTTPEIDAAKAEGTELTKQARILFGETKQANEYFYGGRLAQNSIWGTVTEFEKMTEGVKINQKVDAETLATITTVDLVE
jgi:hypothetical protein